MGDSNYQQVLRKYAARVDDYQNIYSKGPLSQSSSPSQKSKGYYNWLPSATLTKETAEELIIKAEKYWFYPKLSRSQVANILFDKPAGSFIVRESSNVNCRALSVRLPSNDPSVKHYLIETVPNGYAIQGSELPFPSIPKLLAYFCFSTSGGMPCCLRPPMLADFDASTDYSEMQEEVFSPEQRNGPHFPTMGWTGPSTESGFVVKDTYSSPKKPIRPYLEPLEIGVPPPLPPKSTEKTTKKHRSVLLNHDSVDDDHLLEAKPYAVVPIGLKAAASQAKKASNASKVSQSDSSIVNIRKRAPHIYDEIDFISGKQGTESDNQKPGLPKSEESPYMEANFEDIDDVSSSSSYVMSPPPLPPRAPSMTPPPTSDEDEYIEPDVVKSDTRPNRSNSAPPSHFMALNDTSVTTSPSKASKEKKPKGMEKKRSSTLVNLLRTFKKRSPAEPVTRILPENIPSEDVTSYQRSVVKYGLDFPNVAEEAGSELQRRLSGKVRTSRSSGSTLSRPRSLSPMDSYIAMHPENRPSSSCDYYEPMQLHNQHSTNADYDAPYSSSTSPTNEEYISVPPKRQSVRRYKSESSLLDNESHTTSFSVASNAAHFSQSFEYIVPEGKSSDTLDRLVNHAHSVSPSGHSDSDSKDKKERTSQPPRPKKPTVGPKPQLKPKPTLPPKPTVYQRPVAKPRKPPPQQQLLPKVPPKPKSPVSSSMSVPAGHSDTVDKALTNKSSEAATGEDKVLKPVGRPPPPPPKAHSKPLSTSLTSSYVMVKKPTPAKGPYAVPPSRDQDDTKKQGYVVELKESDEELDNVNEITNDTVSSRDSVLGSSEVDGATSVKGTDKRKKTKKVKKNWSPFNFLHKKPAEQRIREYILQLSQNRNTTFGSSVSQFESSTKHEAANLSYQQLLSNVRNHIDSIRDKLLTDHHKELVEHGMKNCRNFDVLLEKILQDIIVEPLQQVIQFKVEKHFTDTGSLKQLQQTMASAKELKESDLGIRDHLIPPGEQAIEEAKQLFDEMERVHSAFTKIELLLQAVRITYNNVQDLTKKNKSSQGLGADDFLPLFIWVLIQAEFSKAEVEAEYMWGLVHPSLLNGEGGYYLTTLTSAVNVLKETQFGPEEVKGLPGMDDSQAFLCVWIDEIDGCTCEPPLSRTLPVHASMTVAETCSLIAETLRISNPEIYALYAITSSSEMLLEKHHFPQRVKHDFLAKHQSGRFVYKPMETSLC
ncbi:uncharacterized protein [Dysidea avara]|uniref:uncharacterized protein isoform X2 n=1 Tax=Dysidea avara TaxID=196820 RepID=UPI00331CC994